MLCFKKLQIFKQTINYPIQKNISTLLDYNTVEIRKKSVDTYLSKIENSKLLHEKTVCKKFTHTV